MATFPPPWPPKPDLYDEVEWGPWPSATDYEQAYNAWRLPYETLRPRHVTDTQDPNQVPLNGWTDPKEVLVGYIHQRFRDAPDSQLFGPNAQQKPLASPDDDQGWSPDEFLILFPKTRKLTHNDITLRGKPLSRLLKNEVRDEFMKRGGYPVGYHEKTPAPIMREKLIDIILDEMNGPDVDERLMNAFPRSRLEDWELNLQRLQGKKALLPFKPNHHYSPLEMYTVAIYLSPYNPTYWAARAYLYLQLNHRDLAIGDAYRALYLIEVVVDVHKRAKRPGLYQRIWDAVDQHIAIVSRTDPIVKALMMRDQGVPYFLLAPRKVSHHIIALGLSELGCYEDARQMDLHLLTRVVMPVWDRKIFERRSKRSGEQAKAQPIMEMSRMSEIAHQQYPQDWKRDGNWEVDTWARHLSTRLFEGWPGKDESQPTPVKISLRREPAEGMTVRTQRQIQKGEVIFAEDPSIRSHLRVLAPPEVISVLNNATADTLLGSKVRGIEYFCENCARHMTDTEVNEARYAFYRAVNAKDGGAALKALVDECSCLFKDPLIPFCLGSARRTRRRVNVSAAPQTASGGIRQMTGAAATTTTGAAGAAAPSTATSGAAGAAASAALDTATAPVATTTTTSTTTTARASLKRPAPSAGDGAGANNSNDEAARFRHMFIYSHESSPPRKKAKTAKGAVATSTTGVQITSRTRAQTAAQTATKTTKVKTQQTTPGKDHDGDKASKRSKVPKGVSCLQIARAKYHHRACGKDWRWLHEAMQTTAVGLGSLSKDARYHSHGTYLSLLFRKVIDITLETRKEDPHRLAFETDALLPHLMAVTPNRSGFWFSYGANILVPFDTLESLGVNIFRELDFDTWVIQTVLRTLQKTALLWTESPKSLYQARPEQMRDLFVFTGATFFKHVPHGQHNAVWEWEQAPDQPRNRIVFRAEKTIEPDEQIKVAPGKYARGGPIRRAPPAANQSTISTPDSEDLPDPMAG